MMQGSTKNKASGRIEQVFLAGTIISLDTPTTILSSLFIIIIIIIKNSATKK